MLCHVIADGQLIATFEPQCNAGLSKVFGEQRWFAASTAMQSVLAWPFQNGRGKWTVFGGTWVGIIGLCLVAGRRGSPVSKRVRRKLLPLLGERAGVRASHSTLNLQLFSFSQLWRSAVTLTLISAFLAGSIGNVEAATYNPVFYYYHTDHLGSSNVLTDRSGNVVQHYEYGTFGQTTYQNNTSAFPVSNRYTGQIADDETGLLYYGGRYYDPQLGRFIQPDPTVPDPTDSQSLNRYSYCRNNPLNATDPSGYETVDTYGDGGDGTDGGNGIYTFGNNGYGYSGIDANGNFFASWTWYSQPMNAPIDYPAITSSLNGGFSESSFMENGFSSPDFSAFGQIPNAAPPPQPGGESGWLKATNAVLTVASLAPGPVGAIASAAQAGLDLVQGHYIEAGIGVAGVALSFVGLGVAAKAIKAAREAREAKMAESLAVDAAKSRTTFEAYKESLKLAEAAPAKATTSQIQLAEQGKIMAGSGGRAVFRDAQKIAAKYGGKPVIG